MLTNCVELPYCNITLVSSDVVCCTFTKDVHYTLEIANAIFEAGNNLHNNNSQYYLITVMHTKLKPDKEVFDFYAHPNRKAKIIAEAFCLNSAALKLMANFYFRVKRPEIPSKVFETKEEAIKWINSIR